MILTYSLCWLNAILFTKYSTYFAYGFRQKSRKCYRGQDVIEPFNETLRNQSGVISIRFVLVCHTFHKNSIYIVFERVHCTGKGSTSRLRLFFFPIYTNSVDGVAMTEFPDGYCQSKRKKSSNRSQYEKSYQSIQHRNFINYINPP